MALDVGRRRVPKRLFTEIVSALKKEKARARKEKSEKLLSTGARAYKDFYIFKLNRKNIISI